MRARLSTALLPAVFVPLATACYIDASTGTDARLPDGSNTPVVGLSSDGMGYALRARDFTSSEQYGPVVQRKSVSVVTAVIGYTAGSATLEIRDASSTVVLQQAVTNNVAQASTVAKGTPPFRVALSFHHFTGAFSLAVGPADSTRTP